MPILAVYLTCDHIKLMSFLVSPPFSGIADGGIAVFYYSPAIKEWSLGLKW